MENIVDVKNIDDRTRLIKPVLVEEVTNFVGAYAL